MTVYMPTILMNIVGHSTMYFKPFFFEAQVLFMDLKLMARKDSIAKMKTETTLSPGFGQSHGNAGPHHHVCQVREQIMILHCKSNVSKVKTVNKMFSVSNDLPRTSYIKMVDVWLVFNLFIPFLEVLLHTYKVTLNFELGIYVCGNNIVKVCRIIFKLKKERWTTMEVW